MLVENVPRTVYVDEAEHQEILKRRLYGHNHFKIVGRMKCGPVMPDVAGLEHSVIDQPKESEYVHESDI